MKFTTFDFYAAVSSLAVSFVHFLKGSLKLFLLWYLFLLFFVCFIHLEYSSSNESDEPDEDRSDELGSESGSAGVFSTKLGGLLSGIGLPLCVAFSDDDSCDGDGGSLFP